MKLYVLRATDMGIPGPGGNGLKHVGKGLQVRAFTNLTAAQREFNAAMEKLKFHRMRITLDIETYPDRISLADLIAFYESGEPQPLSHERIRLVREMEPAELATEENQQETK